MSHAEIGDSNSFKPEQLPPDGAKDKKLIIRLSTIGFDPYDTDEFLLWARAWADGIAWNEVGFTGFVQHIEDNHRCGLEYADELARLILGTYYPGSVPIPRRHSVRQRRDQTRSTVKRTILTALTRKALTVAFKGIKL